MIFLTGKRNIIFAWSAAAEWINKGDVLQKYFLFKIWKVLA